MLLKRCHLIFFVLFLFLLLYHGYVSGGCYDWEVRQITLFGEHTKTSIFDESKIIYSRRGPNWTSEIWSYTRNTFANQYQGNFQSSTTHNSHELDDGHLGHENSTEFQSSSASDIIIVEPHDHPPDPDEGIHEKLSADFVHSFNPQPSAGGVVFHTHQGGSYTVEYVSIPGSSISQITTSGFPMKTFVDKQAGLVLEKEDDVKYWDGNFPVNLTDITDSPFKETNPSYHDGHFVYQTLVQTVPAANQIGLLRAGATDHENIITDDRRWQEDLTNPIMFEDKYNHTRILFESTVIDKDPHLSEVINQIYVYELSNSVTTRVSCPNVDSFFPDPGPKGVAYLGSADSERHLYFYQFGFPDQLILVASDASAFSKPCLFNYGGGSEVAIAYMAIKNNRTEVKIIKPGDGESCYLTSNGIPKINLVASDYTITWLGMKKNNQNNTKPVLQVYAAYYSSGM